MKWTLPRKAKRSWHNYGLVDTNKGALCLVGWAEFRSNWAQSNHGLGRRFEVWAQWDFLWAVNACIGTNLGSKDDPPTHLDQTEMNVISRVNFRVRNKGRQYSCMDQEIRNELLLRDLGPPEGLRRVGTEHDTLRFTRRDSNRSIEGVRELAFQRVIQFLCHLLRRVYSISTYGVCFDGFGELPSNDY